jgi:hypothetical protein
MANADLPRGFRPYGDIKSTNSYSAGGTIYPGDAVKFSAGTSSTTVRRAEVVAGTAGAALCGVALNYAVAGGKVLVADDPSQLFVGQMDEADFDNQVDLGLNCSILATAGSATYKTSRMEIDSSTLATTATLEVRVIGYIERQDGKNELGANVEAIFKINNHQMGSHTGVAGV